MGTVQLIVGKGNNPFSKAIQLFTFSRWSHIGIIKGDYVYEAAAFKGVIKTPLAEFKARYKGKWEIIERDVPNLEYTYNKAEELLGKKYDYFGVFGIAVRLNLNSKNRYQCGEFVATCMGFKRPDYCWRANPQNIWEDSRTIEKGY